MKTTAYLHLPSAARPGPPTPHPDGFPAFREEVRRRFSGVDRDISELKRDVTELKQDVFELKASMAGVVHNLRTIQWMVGLLATLMLGGFSILGTLILRPGGTPLAWLSLLSP